MTRTTYVVTGGAGFIGSHLVEMLLRDKPDAKVVVFDAMTYAANMRFIEQVLNNPRAAFVRGDVADRSAVKALFRDHRPSCVFHLAAESHVDRSISGPRGFLRSNVEGTFELLDAARGYWDSLDQREKLEFRFVNVSTDEVYGSLPPEAEATEESAYEPNSPYSASKAAADHFARAMFSTYGLPVITTHCTNNYGPRQFPERLIPVAIARALERSAVPVYGDGRHSRDWLYVTDHCRGLILAAERGMPGRTYNFASGSELTTTEVVHLVLDELDLQATMPMGSYRMFIRHVTDRPGHDRRYALSAARAKSELNWEPRVSLSDGIYATVESYVISDMGKKESKEKQA